MAVTAKAAYRLIPIQVPTGYTNGNTANINRGLVLEADINIGHSNNLSANNKGRKAIKDRVIAIIKAIKAQINAAQQDILYCQSIKQCKEVAALVSYKAYYRLRTEVNIKGIIRLTLFSRPGRGANREKGINRVGSSKDIKEDNAKNKEEGGEEDKEEDKEKGNNTSEKVLAVITVNRLKEKIQKESRQIIKLYS
ncbi:unnamed protein product [Fusarium fujikuroi]|nr:unnamed protein product [Fusarium fujikuroi]